MLKKILLSVVLLASLNANGKFVYTGDINLNKYQWLFTSKSKECKPNSFINLIATSPSRKAYIVTDKIISIPVSEGVSFYFIEDKRSCEWLNQQLKKFRQTK